MLLQITERFNLISANYPYMASYFFENPSWEHQVRRLMAEVPDGGGEFYEIHNVVEGLRNGNSEDWYGHWRQLSEQTEAKAKDAAAQGNSLMSKALFLRACNYYRMADFYLEHNDPHEIPTYSRIVSCFQAATDHSAPRVELVEVAYEGSKLTGYLVLPRPEVPRPLPVALFLGGADAVKEESYFRGALQAVERGMACLLLDGPGQGDALRLRELFAVPDYERPIGAAIDFLQRRNGIDGERVGLVCASLGGYYAMRAAAYDDRVKACVSWAAVYDVLQDVYDFFPPIQGRLRWVVGARDDAEARTKLKAFNLTSVVEKIKCPLLIVHGEEDYICSIEAAYRAYREARCEKELVVFKKGELGSSHCQQDNLFAAKHTIFDWISKKLGAEGGR